MMHVEEGESSCVFKEKVEPFLMGVVEVQLANPFEQIWWALESDIMAQICEAVTSWIMTSFEMKLSVVPG